MSDTSDWRPISTAPRDGTKALFWIVSKSPEEAYVDTSGNPIFVESALYMAMVAYGGWSSLSKATHWMPLPPPPTEGG